jgi:hypothetical protein
MSLLSIYPKIADKRKYETRESMGNNRCFLGRSKRIAGTAGKRPAKELPKETRRGPEANGLEEGIGGDILCAEDRVSMGRAAPGLWLTQRGTPVLSTVGGAWSVFRDVEART